MLLASLYSSDGGWLQKVAGALLQGVSLGTLDAPTFSPATGYISFFTLALYVAGLLLLPFASDDDIRQTVYAGQLALRESVLEEGVSETSVAEQKNAVELER
jgi:hypothetical protein